MSDIIICPAKLRKGAGNGDPSDGLCIMQMVDWFSGSDRVSDRPKCASPVLTYIAMHLNDFAASQECRDRLWPLVWQLLGSKDHENEQRRIEYIVREIVHRIVSDVFAQVGFHEHAVALKTAQSMEQIQMAAAWAAETAALVAWAARPAAASRAAAWASAAAAVAAARAAWAAETAAGEAVVTLAASAKVAAWGELFKILVGAIALGKHGEEDPVYAPRADQLKNLVESDAMQVVL